MREIFENNLKKIGLSITDEQYFQFETYYELLIDWNKKINLTAITDKREVFEKHFLDSLHLNLVDFSKDIALLDVGSGAGFPSIPLKIIFPSLQVTIIDALQKRIVFLEELTKQLNIKVELIHGRVEDYDKRDCFDIVTARAVANLSMLAELCVPFVAVNGLFIAMKGSNASHEIEEASKALSLLQVTLHQKLQYNLQDQTRFILSFKKNKITDRMYPRKFNLIKSKPL